MEGVREYIVELHDDRNGVAEIHRMRSVLYSDRDPESGLHSAVIEGLRNGKMYGISLIARNEGGIESLRGNTVNFFPNGPFGTSGNPDLLFDGSGTSLTQGDNGVMCRYRRNTKLRGVFKQGRISRHPYRSVTTGRCFNPFRFHPSNRAAQPPSAGEFPLSRLAQAPVFNGKKARFSLPLEIIFPAELNRF